jgi:hypothetical protein
MDVYLIPTAASERYELYYEAPDEEPTSDDDAGGGRLNRWTFGLYDRLRHRVDDMLVEAEQWRHRRHEARGEQTGMFARARRKIMGFVVERIAEQRLLWHLRKVSTVCALIPADLTEPQADAIIRAMLSSDVDHHRKWLIIDGVLLLLSAPLMVVPGPNLPGFYFTFQVVSHYWSWTGARCGVALSPWRFKTCHELTELRDAMRLAPPQRHRRFCDVAERLRLEHLPTFLDDVAARPAYGGGQV